MGEYMTQQRRGLLSFFMKNPDKCFTAREVAENLSQSGISISAVYRNLSRLEQDGCIRRIAKKGSRESLYQSMLSHDCRENIHLSCVKCGNTFHMDCKISEQLLNTVSKTDGFEISKDISVLYGVCTNCNGGKNG